MRLLLASTQALKPFNACGNEAVSNSKQQGQSLAAHMQHPYRRYGGLVRYSYVTRTKTNLLRRGAITGCGVAALWGAVAGLLLLPLRYQQRLVCR